MQFLINIHAGQNTDLCLEGNYVATQHCDLQHMLREWYKSEHWRHLPLFLWLKGDFVNLEDVYTHLEIRVRPNRLIELPRSNNCPDTESMIRMLNVSTNQHNSSKNY